MTQFHPQIAHLGAIVLFFLPWVDIRCVSKRDGSTTVHGWTCGANYTIDALTLSENSDSQARHRAVGGMFLLYFALLIFGLVRFWSWTAERRRAKLGVVLAMAMLSLLLCGVLLLRNKVGVFHPIHHGESLSETEMFVRWTFGLYASFLVQIASLFAFIREWVMHSRLL